MSNSIYVFDLDGTVYLGENPIEGVPETIRALRAEGNAVFFVSNNSSAATETYADRLTEMGIAADSENIILSTDSVIAALRKKNITDTYVVGTTAMCEMLAAAGIEPDADDPTHVVVGFDTELTYEKLRRAGTLLEDGAGFIAAHPDTVCPTPDGNIPDCGAITALFETATGRAPDRVLGKPDPMMLEPVYERTGCDPEDIVVVGDRLSTDIRLANAAGTESVLVLSGDTTDAELAQVEQSAQPTRVLPSAAELLVTA